MNALRMMLFLTISTLTFFARAEDEPTTPEQCSRIATQKAYEVTQKDMKPEDWKKFLKKTNDHFETWRDDNGGGDWKDYLDNQLICIAPSVKSGDVKVLKKFMCWMGLYHVHNEPAPWYVRDLSYENRAAFKQVFQDFSWERLSAMVKNKVKEYESDPEKKKKYEQGLDAVRK